MLGTFFKDFSQVVVSQVWSGNFPNVQFPKRQLPKSVLTTTLGSHACSSRSARPHCSLRILRGSNLTFGKLTLGKLNISHVAFWDFGSHPWENAFGKIPRAWKKNCIIFHFLGIVRSNYIFEQKDPKLRKFWNFPFDRLSIALNGGGPLNFFIIAFHMDSDVQLWLILFYSTNVQVLSNKIC